MIRDLTGKPVFPCAHVENYHHSNDSETTAVYMSEVLRDGGSGMQLYLHNVVEHYNKMGGGRFCYYGHRPRWNTIMEQVDRFCTMKQLRFPKPEYAMFLSDDSALAIANFPDSRCEWLFNLVGPGAGSSFQFISDTQLIDGKIRLKDFPFVLLPAAPIQSKAVQQKFEEYVQNGGMLVCFDPHMVLFFRGNKKLVKVLSREGYILALLSFALVVVQRRCAGRAKHEIQIPRVHSAQK